MQFTAGTYFGTVAGGVVGLARSGNPQMVLTVNVTHQAVNGAWVGLEPTQRQIYLSLFGGAIPYTEEKLARLGFNGDMRSPAFNLDEGVELECKLESYIPQGQQQSKMAERWNLAGDGPAEVQQAPDDVIRKLQAQYNARKNGVMRPTPPTARPAAAKAPAMPAQRNLTQPPPVRYIAPGQPTATDDAPPPTDADIPTGDEIPFSQAQ